MTKTADGWFCESDEHWYPADPNRALTITRDGDRVVFACHLIEKPLELREPVKYTFGWQATPVKKPDKSVWDYRITHSGDYGLESAPAVGPGTSLTYPAAGHVRMEEGTFECWYRPAFDTERQLPVEQRKHMANRSLFTVRGGSDMQSGTNCGFYWNELVQGMVVWLCKQGDVLLNPGGPFDWKAGEWHHVALTWSDKIRIYIDGELLSESPNTGFMPVSVENATIEIVGGGSALATIDEVRILGVARLRPRGTPGPVSDRSGTLLLDHFDNYRDPEAASSERVGNADDSQQFVSARFGFGPTGSRHRHPRNCSGWPRTACARSVFMNIGLPINRTPT